MTDYCPDLILGRCSTDFPALEKPRIPATAEASFTDIGPIRPGPDNL